MNKKQKQLDLGEARLIVEWRYEVRSHAAEYETVSADGFFNLFAEDVTQVEQLARAGEIELGIVLDRIRMEARFADVGYNPELRTQVRDAECVYLHPGGDLTWFRPDGFTYVPPPEGRCNCCPTVSAPDAQ
jgi:hypothetical protein